MDNNIQSIYSSHYDRPGSDHNWHLSTKLQPKQIHKLLNYDIYNILLFDLKYVITLYLILIDIFIILKHDIVDIAGQYHYPIPTINVW